MKVTLGFTGSQGFTGSIGYDGSRGRSGYAGSRGFTGSKGSQGPIGIQGVRGYTGSQGSTGPLGQTGYSGSRGFVGSTGYTGSRGPIGPQGQTGIGFTGSQGPVGFTGSQGGPAEAFRTFRTQNPDGTTSLIIADQPEDVLTFVAAKGITIDFNEATDTITFAGTGEGGGGGNANVIPALTVVNNDPAKISLLEYNETTGVLAYTPSDISGLATQGNVDTALQAATDYANIIVAQEAQIRFDADNDLENYVNAEIARLESELGGNVVIINDTIDEANVYLQGLINLEGQLRANADNDLQDQIDSLESDLSNVSTGVSGNLSVLETQIQQVDANSISRDATLQSGIDTVSADLAQEVLDREAGDQSVQANLDAEVSIIDGQLTTISDSVTAEANARIAADDVLSDRIDAESLRNDDQDGDIDDLEIRVDELEGRVQFSIDYESDLSQLGSISTTLPNDGDFIPVDASGVVVNDWANVAVIKMNAVDDEGSFHFLDNIKVLDDLVFNARNQSSYARVEVTANVVLQTSGNVTYANVEVTPVAFNGNIIPGDGSNTTLNDAYLVNYYPNVSGDVPNYDYVDTQDNRRVLKTGDIMTGSLILHEDPTALLQAATKQYVDGASRQAGRYHDRSAHNKCWRIISI